MNLQAQHQQQTQMLCAAQRRPATRREREPAHRGDPRRTSTRHTAKPARSTSGCTERARHRLPSVTQAHTARLNGSAPPPPPLTCPMPTVAHSKICCLTQIVNFKHPSLTCTAPGPQLLLQQRILLPQHLNLPIVSWFISPSPSPPPPPQAHPSPTPPPTLPSLPLAPTPYLHPHQP